MPVEPTDGEGNLTLRGKEQGSPRLVLFSPIMFGELKIRNLIYFLSSELFTTPEAELVLKYVLYISNTTCNIIIKSPASLAPSTLAGWKP